MFFLLRKWSDFTFVDSPAEVLEGGNERRYGKYILLWSESQNTARFLDHIMRFSSLKGTRVTVSCRNWNFTWLQTSKFHWRQMWIFIHPNYVVPTVGFATMYVQPGLALQLSILISLNLTIDCSKFNIGKALTLNFHKKRVQLQVMTYNCHII